LLLSGIRQTSKSNTPNSYWQWKMPGLFKTLPSHSKINTSCLAINLTEIDVLIDEHNRKITTQKEALEQLAQMARNNP
ncbi:hypothetical protein, partial [Alishewanella longhuensis]